MGQLDGKRAIVTGGASGFGQVISQALGQEGASVAVWDVRQEGAESTAGSITAGGGAAAAVAVDVSDPDSVQMAVAKSVEALGGVDIMVNCAGVMYRTPIVDMPVDEWRQVIDINLTGIFLCNQAVARQMIAQGGGGKIVNFASGRGVTGSVNSAHYAASKGGVLAFTLTMGMEVAPHGINVNAICPGATDTPMMRGGLTEEQLQARMGADVTYNKRIGQPEDIIGPILFLVSDGSREMYGQTLFVKSP